MKPFHSRGRSRSAFTLIELLVVIAIIAILIGLLLPAVQKVREAAARAQCVNNLKQMALGAHAYESAFRKLPSPGQCSSSGSNTTVYDTFSFGMHILPYIEQGPVYNLFDASSNPQTNYGNTGPVPGVNAFLTTGGESLHNNSRGRHYADTAFPSGQQAAKTVIKIFVCPSTPYGNLRGDDYGPVDYMVVAVTDIEDDPGQAEFKGRASTARRVPGIQGVLGMCTCDGNPIEGVQDGTSNTILVIEDAGRSHPDNGQTKTVSNRSLPGSSNDGVRWSGGASNGRRVHAWADSDAFANGVSGPPASAADYKRKILNQSNSSPPVGPANCAWAVNNCGPNDEPFSFHTGVVNAAMGDGSVRALRENLDPLVVKALAGATDGVPISNLD